MQSYTNKQNYNILIMIKNVQKNYFDENVEHLKFHWYIYAYFLLEKLNKKKKA